MAEDLFASPKLTLRRAEHHIEDFNASLQRFIREHPWTYFIQKNADGTVTHKLRLGRQLPEELPCILFDASNNLRATLDQIGYATAIASGKVDPKSTHFPFGSDAVEFENNIKRGRCKDLPPVILTFFRGFKGYEGGNDTLWALNKLCNTKKHCALVPLVIVPKRVSVGNSPSGILAPFGWDSKKNEIILLRARPEAEFDRNKDFSFQVAIQSIEVLRGKQASGVLGELLRIVQGILLGTEAECRHTGLIP